MVALVFQELRQFDLEIVAFRNLADAVNRCEGIFGGERFGHQPIMTALKLVHAWNGRGTAPTEALDPRRVRDPGSSWDLRPATCRTDRRGIVRQDGQEPPPRRHHQFATRLADPGFWTSTF